MSLNVNLTDLNEVQVVSLNSFWCLYFNSLLYVPASEYTLSHSFGIVWNVYYVYIDS
jgi:hypothetical protein